MWLKQNCSFNGLLFLSLEFLLTGDCVCRNNVKLAGMSRFELNGIETGQEKKREDL